MHIVPSPNVLFQSVALKKLEFKTKTSMKKIMDFIKSLLNTDIDHDNILKYHGVEVDKITNTIYLALDFYQGTLHQGVQKRIKGIQLDTMTVSLEILHQITEGVAYLHQNKIAHKNLEPGNILLVRNSDSEIRAKIADVGVGDEKSDTGNSKRKSHDLWKAPEFENEQKITGACDIFSLGCIFHYVLTGGKYPFGDSKQKGFVKEVNYLRIPELVLGNLWLIREMTTENPKKRPKIKDILSHHIFWTSEKTLNFLIQIANLTEAEEGESSDVKAILREMEKYYDRVVSKRFGYQNHLQTYRHWLKFMGMDEDEYSTTCVKRVHKNYEYKHKLGEFLKLIRNLGTDFEEFPQHVRNVVGKPPEEFLEYWRHQFPLLVPMLWIVFQKLRSDSDEYEMKQFYGNRHIFSFQSDNLYCYAYEMFLSVKQGNLLQENVERLSNLLI